LGEVRDGSSDPPAVADAERDEAVGFTSGADAPPPDANEWMGDE
jgi:hypothetical protein